MTCRDARSSFYHLGNSGTDGTFSDIWFTRLAWLIITGHFRERKTSRLSPWFPIGMCDRMRGSIVWRGLNSWRIEKPTRPNHSAVYCNRHITTGDWRTELVQLSSPSENSH